MPQLNDRSAVPTSFWRASTASHGRSWLKAGQGTPQGRLWRISANCRIRVELWSCTRRKMLKLNLSGCAKLPTTADKYAQQVHERMDSSVPLSWQPQEFSLKNFCHVARTLPCVSCRLLRFWHEIMVTVSHWHQNLESQEAPRHGQCAARLRPYITAVIFHIKGHDLTLTASQVGWACMSSRANVHVFTDASF